MTKFDLKKSMYLTLCYSDFPISILSPDLTLSFKLFYDSIVLNAFSDKKLIADLLKTKFGQGYLATAKFYFQAFSSVNCNSFMESYAKNHNNYVDKKIFRKVLKPAKYAYLNIKKRLILIVNNVSYRKHILNLRFIFKK